MAWEAEKAAFAAGEVVQCRFRRDPESQWGAWAALNSADPSPPVWFADQDSEYRIAPDEVQIKYVTGGEAQHTAPDDEKQSLEKEIKDLNEVVEQLGLTNESLLAFAIKCRKERDHWKANHDNQVRLKNEVAETRFLAMSKQIDELLDENAKLKEKLDAAPHWVPVGSLRFEYPMGQRVVYGELATARGMWCWAEAGYFPDGDWYAGKTKMSVTHVLVGLNPPVTEKVEGPRRDPDDPRGDGDQDDKRSPPIQQPDIARDRLLQPFLGTEAEMLGATKYQLGESERWEYRSSNMWLWEPSSRPPVWYKETTYRLAGDVSPAPHAVAQPVDMLGRDVVDGDVMWDVSEDRLRPHEGPRKFDYKHSVRCPRPGEQVPDFEGWREMCGAMHNHGARFIHNCESACGGCWFFDESADRYRRSPDYPLNLT